MGKNKKRMVSVAPETKKLPSHNAVLEEEQLLLPLLHKEVYTATVNSEKAVLEESPNKAFIEPKPGSYRVLYGKFNLILERFKRRHLDLDKEIRNAFVVKNPAAR